MNDREKVIHQRQRKQLWLEVYLECIKKHNGGWYSAWDEASKAVECFDEEFNHTPLLDKPKETES
jgi:hypothetical protein